MDGVVYASFSQRLGAWILDQVLLFVFSFCLGIVIGLVIVLGGGTVSDDLKPVLNIVGVIISWLYYSLQESSSSQATLGKKMMGIKVIGPDNGRISFGRATGRYFGKIISGLALLIGYLSVLWHPQKRAWHDSMANTFVVLK